MFSSPSSATVQGSVSLPHYRTLYFCEFDPRPGQYSRMSFSPDQVTGTVFSHLKMPFQILNLFRTLSSWGRGNYRPSAPLLYEVASHVKQQYCHSGHYYLSVAYLFCSVYFFFPIIHLLCFYHNIGGTIATIASLFPIIVVGQPSDWCSPFIGRRP